MSITEAMWLIEHKKKSTNYGKSSSLTYSDVEQLYNLGYGEQ